MPEIKRGRSAAIAFAVVLLASACTAGASPTPSAAGGTPAAATPTPPPAGSIAISGAGATFPFPLYSRWFYEYAFIDPSVKFNYQSIGSGGGIKQITARTVDFGASDAILNADQYTAAPGIQMFPTVAGSEVIAYNVAELVGKTALIIDGPTLASIFLGKISNWNDAALAALNPGVTLPDKPIVVVHRSDGSGTTFIFTDYLSNISPDWKNTVGNSSSVQWPVGLGGKGNEGVSGTLGQTEGSIGYVELAYAVNNKLAYAKMVNASGATVKATIAGTQSAMADFGTDLPATLSRSIVNGTGAASWPISGYTYLLLYMDQTDCTKAAKLAAFVNWALGADGSKFATDLLYAPLPDAVKTKVLARIAQITCNGQPLPAN
ncbi:MAG: phosphate ABC transporter substrate-binding protein PstS [Candidatus Limnocylindrales bacterium]